MTFVELPAELVAKICELCSIDDVVSLSQASSVLRRHCERLLLSEPFWESVAPWRGRFFFDSNGREIYIFDRAIFSEQEPVSDRTFSFLKTRTDICQSIGLDLRESNGYGSSHVARSAQVLCWKFEQRHTGAVLVRRHRPCYETRICCCAVQGEAIGNIAYRPYSQIEDDQFLGCCSRSDRGRGQPPTLNAARDVDLITSECVRWNEDYLIWERKKDRGEVSGDSWDWMKPFNSSWKLHPEGKGLKPVARSPAPTPAGGSASHADCHQIP